MRENVRVVLWGLGSMGSGIAKMILGKKGISIVGVTVHTPAKIGKRLYELLGLEATPENDIPITGRPEDIVRKGTADVALIATQSFIRDVFSQVKTCVEARMNVITLAEEMAYPWAADPYLSNEIDRLARDNGVTVLGTGINPGFIMDLLVIALTGVCEDISSIKVCRVNDLSPFGKAVMRGQGVGLMPEEFARRVEDGTVVGHVGFAQSFGMLEKALNLRFTKTEQLKEPIVTNVERSTDVISVRPGQVAGCRQVGHAYLDDKTFVELEHPQQIRPEAENVTTGDCIEINGLPNIRLQGSPEIPGGTGTIAICVNMIPHVINADPGLKSMLDLPVPRALLGDVRDLIRTK
ncbi:MAG: NADP-binding protein [Chloroflexi bacterium]|nr:NADP-binding protein [Chloroflexota bacterium]